MILGLYTIAELDIQKKHIQRNQNLCGRQSCQKKTLENKVAKRKSFLNSEIADLQCVTVPFENVKEAMLKRKKIYV